VGGDVFKHKVRRPSLRKFSIRKTSPEEQRQWKLIHSTFIVDFFFAETNQTGQELDDAVAVLWEAHIKGKFTLESEIAMGPVRAVKVSRGAD
jgi:hypothetical protein